MNSNEIKLLVKNISNCAVLNTLENLHIIFTELNNNKEYKQLSIDDKFVMIEKWLKLSIDTLKENEDND